IVGVSHFNHGGVPAGFANYFVVVFDRPFAASGVWSPESVQADGQRLDGKQVGAFVKFETGTNGVVGCKATSSFLSPEQALRNLQSEVGDADFDTLRQRAEDRWNQALGRVRL